MREEIKSGTEPIELELNRVAYLMKGGELLKKFYGYEDGQNRYSQVWLASVVTSALTDGKEGLSKVKNNHTESGAEREIYLKELLDGNPVLYMGEHHVKRYGSSPGILVKLLNSKMRLLVQVHPSKEMAMKYFHSPFGKTESWYVLETDEEKKAYIYAGFRPGVTKENFRQLIEKQDTEKILRCLHQFEIKKGDMIYIPAGLPHALGKGSLIVELQEPVDITLRAERVRPDGSELPEESLHSGIGLDAMMECFDFTCREASETWNNISVMPEVVCSHNDVEEICRIGGKTTSRFGMNEIIIQPGDVYCKKWESFAVLLVLEGRGNLMTGGREYELRQGSEYFLPYGMGEGEYRADEKMKLLECYPPGNL